MSGAQGDVENFISNASFWIPDSFVPSAWIEHAPFAFWLIDVHRPRILVELGTQFGYSYLAFNQAVKRLGLPTRCFAIDTWKEDEHTGLYGQEVFERLREYHDRCYSSSSRLVRSTFDEAVKYFQDGTIDLLHINRWHFCDDLRQEFETWKPKLSDRAVVLFHSTSERNFGVCRLWNDLQAEYPHFEFIQGYGLGIVGVGSALPEAISALLAASTDSAITTRVREIYNRLGSSLRDQWILKECIVEQERLRAELAERTAELNLIRASASWHMTAPVRTIGSKMPPRLKRQVRSLIKATWWTITLQLPRRVRKHIRLRRESKLIAGSGLFDKDWYLAQNPDVAKAGADPMEHYLLSGGSEGRDPSPLFDSDWYLAQNPDVGKAGVNPLVHYVGWGKAEGRAATVTENSKGGRLAEVAIAQEQPRRKQDGLVRGRRPRVVFVSGELHTPGHQDRILNMAQSLAPQFFETIVIRIEELSHRLTEVVGTDMVWIGLTSASEHIAALLETARRERAKIICDVDDLTFRPELATAEIIAGIRSQKLAEGDVQEFYKCVQAVLSQADHCTAPTLTLAREARNLRKPTTVIPNGFDRRMLEKARAARRAHTAKPDDGLIRIGYAEDSPTHQRDLAVASPALAAVLAENPNVRLVLFRGGVNLTEFPELQEFSGQIEWREHVPIEELPSEYARFDINLAPLEVAKRFSEATSELKFFEAALVCVPTVASRTGPFTDLIRHDETGFLANSEDEWSMCFRTLIRDRELRERTAERLYSEVLWLYGPERRSLLVTRLVNRLLAPAPLSSELFRLEMDTGSAESLQRPELAEYDVLYQSSRLAASRVSVVIPLFNYAHYVQEALESVRQQTVRDIDVIVVDDRSTDDSVAVARTWLEDHAGDFNMVALLQNRRNSNLARTRNTAINFCDTELFFPLDPDNLLLPDCIEKCLASLDETGAAFAYPTILWFGEKTGMADVSDYDPALFQSGNYIDAMALVRKACWVAVGGYTRLAIPGWEDYEFWCKLGREGFFGARVPDVTAKYRVHATSMVNSVTGVPENKLQVIHEITSLHPWLGLRVPGTSDAGESVPQVVASPSEH